MLKSGTTFTIHGSNELKHGDAIALVDSSEIGHIRAETVNINHPKSLRGILAWIQTLSERHHSNIHLDFIPNQKR